MKRTNSVYRHVFSQLRVRQNAQGALVSCYTTTPVFDRLTDNPLPPRLRVHRLCLPHFRWGQDYAEYFDGLDVGKAKLLFDGLVEPQNRRKFEFLDRRAACGKTYAYWVSSPAGRLATGPIPIRMRDPHIWWPHDVINARLMAMVTQYPKKVEALACGTTAGGRELTALLVGNPQQQIALLGAVHAGESGPELLIPAVERLLEHEPELLEQVGIALLPSVNADERDRLAFGCPWYLRTNANGVDINRNFDAGWETVDRNYGYISSDPDAMTWRGPAANSEPETRAVVRFVETIRPVAVFSYHSLACITGATFLAPQSAKADEPYLLQCGCLTDAYRGAFYPTTPAYGSMHCGTTCGSLPSYVYQRLHMPAFDVEWDGNPAFKNSHYDLTTPAMLADCRERHYQGLRAVLKLLAHEPTQPKGKI